MPDAPTRCFPGTLIRPSPLEANWSTSPGPPRQLAELPEPGGQLVEVVNWPTLHRGLISQLDSQTAANWLDCVIAMILSLVSVSFYVFLHVFIAPTDRY